MAELSGKKGLILFVATFIITEDLTPTVSLEDYCANWLDNPPTFSTKQMIIRRVAKMVRKMHATVLTIVIVIFAIFYCICHLREMKNS